ncbi:hypothetical protein D4764_19G0003190 [Takifugu flavidus]|uniref:Reverse transcriptase domain-containing protein n=1 Tax=Takifugu flavidus TaxID=433684 RepID=A0A5C6NPJ5_9TELE|nr:hypothetical protein D4764_19G0003190 [Takifugu flavidus]
MTDVVSTSVRRKKWREYWKVKASHIQEGALFSLVSVWQISQEDFKDIIIQELTWKKFYVHLAGCTGGAHLHIVDLLKQLNQSEVFSPEESDYIVVFCPVRSHIRTDISVALETVPALKPTILVVLHHTFDPDSVEADSKRQVCNRLPDLCSPWTVFQRGQTPQQQHNKAAYMEIIKLIATSYQGYVNKYVRLGKTVSDSVTISTGSPQGCVLSPLLFSLYTNCCTSSHQSVKLIKFADDTTLIGLISNGDETAYRREVARLVSWCGHNNLQLNAQRQWR